MIADILHKIMGMEREDEHVYRPRPSSAGPERCIRQMVYSRRGQVRDHDLGDRFLNVLDDSSWHAELIAALISKSAYQLHSREMRVTCWDQDGLRIEGDIDGLLTDLLGRDRLLECKALNHFTFEGYWSLKEYPEDYFTQTALYLRGVRRLNPDIDEAVLLVKNKNTSGYIEYLLRYDESTDTLTIVSLTRHTGETVEVNQVRVRICGLAIEKFQQVEAQASAGTLPERPYEQDHWRCRYCPFSETCWKGYVEEIESLADDANLEGEEADTVRYFQQKKAEIKEQEKEVDELKERITASLKAKQAKKAKAGEYVVTLVAQERKAIEWDAVPLQLMAALETYKKSTISEFIKVSKQKATK
jgi:hypothetical protein